MNIDPVLFSLGPIQVRWYGLMYVIGYTLGTQLLKILSRRGFFKIPENKIDSYVFYIIIGMLIGARLAYVFVYNWDYYSLHLVDIFSVWKGGLSFHGAVVGMSVASWMFAKKNNLHFFHIGDAMALAGTQGLFFGRLGNFINGELYGRVTDSPIGIVFANGGPYPRHASQLYEGILEGIVLSAVLWFLLSRVRIYGALSAVFLLGYGFFRYVVEFFREPDSQLGYYFGGTTTMGQILCLLMMVASIFMYLYAKKVSLPVSNKK
ncbi:MAG: prolipoprotein diacylglyceryl transferase [Bacteriovoracaceae bacterium]|nr:prolipoprotein diacylglyceryl transferase [Bacteriovoracaceae bacterium]